MSLQQSHINELKRIHKEEFGEELSDDAAWEMGNRLIGLFGLLLTIEQRNAEPKPPEQPPVPPALLGQQQRLF